MIDFVEYGNSKIEFKIKWSLRKSLGISILPTGDVEVTAPEGADINRVKEAVIKRAAWVLEQKRLANFNPIQMPSKQFVSGETYYYLGRQYRLKLFASNYNQIDILDDRFILNCTDLNDAALKQSLLISWFEQRAKMILSERFNHLKEKFNQLNTSIAVKKLSKSWGEFNTSKKLVTLNSELIVAPVECIDYVIIHELSHEIVDGHNSEFYNLMSRRLKNWRDLKNQLEGYSQGFSLFD